MNFKKIKKIIPGFFPIILFFCYSLPLSAQIYQHDFGTTAISTHPYTVSPAILDANLNTSSWSNSTSAWTSFTGSTGQAIALSNSSGTPTITLTFNVASGYQLSVSSFSFWRQRSASGAQNWSMTVNGISAGSGTVPTTGANTGALTPGSTIANLTGTITVVISLSGASGAGTFRLDDFTLNGTVLPLGSVITATPLNLTGFTYMFGSGPSASQSYTLTGAGLVPAAGNISVTAPTDYEVSTDNITFSASLTLPYAGSALAATTIYVRLKAGLAIGSYNLENVVNSGGGASSVNVVCSGTVAAATTVFTPGDIAVLGVNSNAICLGGTYISGDDEISFVCFKDITPGTSFYITDNGYERVNAGQWGDTEGCYLITRTGTTLTAGTVMTFRFLNAAPFVEYINPDVNWTFAKTPGIAGNMVLNTNGDQLYFTQGGSWVDGGGSHDLTYTGGTFLFAFNTNNSWTSFGASTQQSGLIYGMECFNMMPGVATDFIKYNGPVTATSKRGWIDRINTPANWINCGVGSPIDPALSCANYNSTLPNYAAGYSITITAGTFSPGVWTGARNTDWFNCGNWQDMEVPDRYTNVTIPPVIVPNEPTIGDPPTVPVAYVGAECNDIRVDGSHTLTMNHVNSRLDVYGNIVINGSLSATNGIVNILNVNNTLSASAPPTFYNLCINKTATSNTFTIGNTISVSNILTLTSGLITTGINRVVVSNNAMASVTGHGMNSYVNGNLRRNVASTGTYDFPVGTASNYELAQIIFNSSSGLTYIDASFSSPHVTPMNISALSLMVGGTLLEELLDYGYWTLTPNAGTYNYDVLLTSRGHSNPGATASAHAVIKRPNSSSNWVSEGTHNNTDQTMGAGWVTGVRRQLTVFSDFAIAKSLIGPLPVELLSFSANLDGKEVFLKWSTASETNNNFFTVERSADGLSFEVVGIVSGSGNSNTLLEYSLHDISPLVGINYYRLKQTDFDGKFSYSNVISVSTENNQGEAQLVANSAASELELYLNLSSEDKISVTIFDLSGKKIFSESIYSEPGLRSIHFRLPTMSNGIYLGEVIGKNLIVKQKFVY